MGVVDPGESIRELCDTPRKMQNRPLSHAHKRGRQSTVSICKASDTAVRRSIIARQVPFGCSMHWIVLKRPTNCSNSASLGTMNVGRYSNVSNRRYVQSFIRAGERHLMHVHAAGRP